MASYTKTDVFLGGVFTLQNGVRKNNSPHGGNWPPLGPQWGTQYLNDGGIFPHGGPNDKWWGEAICQWAKSMVIMMSYVQCSHKRLQVQWLSPMGTKGMQTLDYSARKYCSIANRECRFIEGRATFNFRCWPATISGYPLMYSELWTLPKAINTVVYSLYM